MYALDLYDGLSNILTAVMVISCIGFALSVLIPLCGLYEQNHWFPAFKTYIIWFGVITFLSSFMMAVWPSKNTVKVFMGVKAVQAVATYVDDTDIPERTKATVTKLWDKVDGYITSIDVESKADSTGTVIKSGVQSVADSTAKDIAKEVVNTVKN